MIRLGIVGYGRIGKARAKEAELINDVDIVAIYDVNSPQDCEYKVVNNFDELLKMVDAVFICTFNIVKYFP